MSVYFFTRTGRSEKIANEIAQSKGLMANKILDGIDWKGAGKFLKGGYMTSKKQSVPIEYSSINDSDEIVLVFPVWAGGFPPAIRTFIEEVGRERIIAVPTSLTSKIKDREGFIKVYDLIGKEISTPKELI